MSTDNVAKGNTESRKIMDKKRKLAFITPKMNLGGGVTLGVQKKVEAQIDAFRDLGFTVEYFGNSPYRYPPSTLRRLNLAREILRSHAHYTQSYQCLAEQIQAFSPDAIYCRYNFSDRLFIDFLKEIRGILGSHIPFYLEIPTFPYDMELLSSGNLGLRFLYLSDLIFRRSLHNYIDRIVTFSSFPEIFGLPTIQIGNGIDIKSIHVHKGSNPEPRNGYHFIGVANLVCWVAYDRMIAGMGDYVKNGSKPAVHFHIVGDGPERDRLQRLACNSCVEGQVSFHGPNQGSILDDLFSQAHLAIGNLGGHRRGLSSNQDLKNREYCARGIPFVTSTLDPGFPPDFRFILPASPDDTPIRVKGLIDFIERLRREHPGYGETMREYARRNLDWSVMLAPVAEAFKDSR